MKVTMVDSEVDQEPLPFFFLYKDLVNPPLVRALARLQLCNYLLTTRASSDHPVSLYLYTHQVITLILPSIVQITDEILENMLGIIFSLWFKLHSLQWIFS